MVNKTQELVDNIRLKLHELLRREPNSKINNNPVKDLLSQELDKFLSNYQNNNSLQEYSYIINEDNEGINVDIIIVPLLKQDFIYAPIKFDSQA